MQTELRLHEATFRAMGSHCRIVCDVEASVHRAIDRLEDLESRWSRFLPSSEVSMLNRAAGEWCDVSEMTHHLVRRAVEAQTLTNGVMNPLMLRELTALGYDRSHELLVADGECADTRTSSPPRSSDGPIESVGGRIRLPPGTAFDPGGLGKGLAADVVMEDLLDAGATWALVSLGGDLRFGGRELEARGWDTHIEDPFEPSHAWGIVNMSRGALATSSILSRRWVHEGTVRHHLLDPVTRLPSASGRIAATVHAEHAWWADVVAKVLVIDASLGVAQLAPWGAKALVFTANGTIDMGLLA